MNIEKSHKRSMKCPKSMVAQYYNNIALKSLKVLLGLTFYGKPVSCIKNAYLSFSIEGRINSDREYEEEKKFFFLKRFYMKGRKGNHDALAGPYISCIELQ